MLFKPIEHSVVGENTQQRGRGELIIADGNANCILGFLLED